MREREPRTREDLLARLRREVPDGRVVEAMARVPREEFVPPDVRPYAYLDRPLPVGEGQTISQPTMVGVMTSHLGLTGTEKVLEVGTGSGYQTAILAELAERVVTVERVVDLLHRARDVLDRLGYTNVESHLVATRMGWPAGAPYDAIIVTAAAPAVPRPLVDQLAEGGRLVIPVGSRQEQELLLVTRSGTRTGTKRLGPCRFVPLIGPGAWPQA